MLTSTIHTLIPKPVSVVETGELFSLTADTQIYVERGNDKLAIIGSYLADYFNAATGYGIRMLDAEKSYSTGAILLTTVDSDPSLGGEGYSLSITTDGVAITARQATGVFRGVQTLRQLFPPSIEQTDAQSGPWQLPTGTIIDYPRFAWRGAMLDVARHFFGVEDVKHFIDLMAYYKLNRLHLHLSDDQGWRIVIDSWPNLATHGGSTAVGGGKGGYYTQQQYAEIAAYAQSRYITIVPEIDLPGHTNAALASYPELNCNGIAPSLYTGIEVGFSSLCIEKELTYQFVDDVIAEMSAITPGPYIHVGGDEAHSTEEGDYCQFMQRVQEIVHSHGKQMVGWAEAARTDLAATTIVQYWNTEPTASAAIAEALSIQQHHNVIMSPGSRAYLDMKYDSSCKLGLHWAGYIEVKDAYEWEPTALLDGIEEHDIVGVEAPLWSETILTRDDVAYMAFPRLIGIAEIGWSPAAGRGWDEYCVRLGSHEPRLAAMGVNFYRSPQVPWEQ